MLNYEWDKFYTSRFIQSAQGHKNSVIGMFIRIWCALASNKTKWSKKASLSEWTRIIQEDAKTSRMFINYLSDKWPEIAVKSHVATNGEAEYTIIAEWYRWQLDKKTKSTERTRKHRKTSKLTATRKKFLETIINSYHPERNSLQMVTARANFTKVMVEASTGLTTTDKKIAAETEVYEKIISYIKHLKTTKEWDTEGKYLLGLGNFIKERPWAYKSSNGKIQKEAKKTKKATLKTKNLKDEIMNKISGGDK